VTAPSRAALACAVALGSCAIGAGRAHAIVFGQLDNFQNGTTMDWTESAPSPNLPTNVPNGGPNGPGDAYVENISAGGIGAGSRMIMYNQVQWAGNYTAAGVTRITAMMSNFGATDLYMRIAFQGGTFSTIFGSSTAVHLPAGSGWQPVTFSLTAANVSNVNGTETLADVLANVSSLRILSAQNAPSFMGDSIAGTLGVDNIRAMTIPGDANLDANVTLADFNLLAANFGAAGTATWQTGDFNFDTNVDLADFNLLAGNFGLSASAHGPSASDWSALTAAVVPEPSSVAVLGTGIVAVLRRRSAR
jgi:hypothetical protein